MIRGCNLLAPRDHEPQCSPETIASPEQKKVVALDGLLARIGLFAACERLPITMMVAAATSAKATKIFGGRPIYFFSGTSTKSYTPTIAR